MLVIIGLLIGGILVAQSLIESAKVNRFISEVQQYEIVIKQFKKRFRYWPGDHPKAYATFGSDCGINNAPASPVYNGCNGNGKLFSGSFAETNHFWYHLSHAGFLGDARYDVMNVGTESQQIPGVTAPKFSLDEKLMATGFSNSTWLYGIAPNSAGTNGIWFGVCYSGSCDPHYLSVALSRAVDAKVDDGFPGMGTFFSRRDSAGVTAGHCVTTLSAGTARYRSDDTGDDSGCSVIFRNLNEDVAL